jgi:nucleoside phosphorylase
VCASGLAAEARIARAAGFSTVVGAGDRRRTAALVESSTRRATCLVSFGIAGALAAELRPGDIVISTEVIAEDGRWRANSTFLTLSGRLTRAVGGIEGVVLGAPHILATPAEKNRARNSTGALAVDLESDIVARIACATAIPFIAIRAIADTADCELPPAALISLTENGTPRIAEVLGSLLRRPQQLAALVGLACAARTALAALVGPARALGNLVASA